RRRWRSATPSASSKPWSATSISDPRSKRNGRGFPRPFAYSSPTKLLSPWGAGGARRSGPPPRTRLAEERDDGLRRLVGDRQRLHAQLLLDLQRLEHRALVGHVGVDQVADAGGQRIGQLLGKADLDRELLRAGRQFRQGGVDVGQR